MDAQQPSSATQINMAGGGTFKRDSVQVKAPTNRLIFGIFFFFWSYYYGEGNTSTQE